MGVRQSAANWWKSIQSSFNFELVGWCFNPEVWSMVHVDLSWDSLKPMLIFSCFAFFVACWAIAFKAPNRLVTIPTQTGCRSSQEPILLKNKTPLEDHHGNPVFNLFTSDKYTMLASDARVIHASHHRPLARASVSICGRALITSSSANLLRIKAPALTGEHPEGFIPNGWRLLLDEEWQPAGIQS